MPIKFRQIRISFFRELPELNRHNPYSPRENAVPPYQLKRRPETKENLTFM